MLPAISGDMSESTAAIVANAEDILCEVENVRDIGSDSVRHVQDFAEELKKLNE